MLSLSLSYPQVELNPHDYACLFLLGEMVGRQSMQFEVGSLGHTRCLLESEEQYEKAISLESACALELITSARAKLKKALALLQALEHAQTRRKYKVDHLQSATTINHYEAPLEMLSFAIHQFRVLLGALGDSWTHPEVAHMLELVVYELAKALYFYTVHSDQELYTEVGIMQTAHILDAAFHVRSQPALSDHNYLYVVESQSRYFSTNSNLANSSNGGGGGSSGASTSTNSSGPLLSSPANPPPSAGSSIGRRVTKVSSRRAFSFAVTSSSASSLVPKTASSLLPNVVPDTQCSMAIYQRQLDSFARASTSTYLYQSNHVLWPRPVTLDSNTILSTGNILAMLVPFGFCKYVAFTAHAAKCCARHSLRCRPKPASIGLQYRVAV